MSKQGLWKSDSVWSVGCDATVCTMPLCVPMAFQCFHSGTCSVVQTGADLLNQASTDVIQYMEISTERQSVPLASWKAWTPLSTHFLVWTVTKHLFTGAALANEKPSWLPLSFHSILVLGDFIFSSSAFDAWYNPKGHDQQNIQVDGLTRFSFSFGPRLLCSPWKKTFVFFHFAPNFSNCESCVRIWVVRELSVAPTLDFIEC